MAVTATAAVDYTADQDGASTSGVRTGVRGGFGYLATGTALGIVFVKSEVLSWYRIQEMFRFQSFHMFGVIAVAVAVASLSQAVLTRLQVRSSTGEHIHVAPKLWTPSGSRYWLGGAIFGLGWSLLGACPGPLFTLIGAGQSVYVVPLAAALAGTYLYAVVRDRLPH